MIGERQVRAVTTGVIVVEPALRRDLLAFEGPLAFLDFEAVSVPIPRWTGCRPWEHVPVQFSVHRRSGPQRHTHHEWIAQGPADPRPAIARQLVAACRGAGSIVAYYAEFERRCLRHLIEWEPDHAAELESIESRLVDLYPLVRNRVYHPDFGGSFSIKHVLPALVPQLSYADLEIQDGEVATVELRRLLFHGEALAPEAYAELRASLLRYCERDSWAMVRLHERLRALAQTEQLEMGV